ncbi:MAG: bifunctional (p)ppGpp synthetase/guanosine-3',5'-bis(diphosphate) 3'-pyrophosphohydrolase [Candidatus Sericytochromatia bacterium]
MQSNESNKLQLKDISKEVKEDPYEKFLYEFDPEAQPRLENLLKKSDYISNPSDIELIKKAFSIAVNFHGSQKRASGDPYYLHPVQVAEILTTLGADPEMICAGLMHDVLEDTDYPAEKMKEVFGEKIYLLVDGVTKLGKISFSSKEERQAESFRRMFMAMAKDIRVIVIKLCDRLHNMRTLNHLAPEKQKRIAKETIEIFSPLANRLGIGKIKWELEDMCLRYLYPDDYWKITKYISQKREVRENFVFSVISELENSLKENHIQAEISGRPKHFYSIHQKMIQQNKEFHELYDIVAVRVKVKEKHDCYEVLGVVHSIFKPIPGRFKDYIAMPKPNLYQSLHTTVIGPEGYPVEIQIRTHDMHRIAEYGIAAHWVYKEKTPSPNTEKSAQQLQLSWLRQLLEWQNDLKDANEYMHSVKVDLFTDEVFVFTPNGDVYSLPTGSTPVDFAYRIHTDVGHRCVGAKINGKIVPLTTPLNNGDQAEIILSKVKQPSLDWINFVVTSHAKNRIRQWFKKEQKETNILRGKQLLDEELKKQELDSLPDKQKRLDDLYKKLNYHTLDDMYSSIGYGELTSNQVINRIKHDLAQEKTPTIEDLIKEKPITKKKESDVLVDGLDGLLVNMATCCNPLPGESIKGVVSRSKGFMIHEASCFNLHKVNKGRVIDVEWGKLDKEKRISYPADIEVHCLDRIGLLKDIITKLSDSKINILGANVVTDKSKTATIYVKVEVNSYETLQKIMNTIKNISDVLNVSRVKNKKVTKKTETKKPDVKKNKTTKNKKDKK